MNCSIHKKESLFDTPNIKMEVGKCYFSIIDEESDNENFHYQDGFILEINEAILKKKIITLSEEEIKKVNELGEDEYFSIQSRPPHSTFIRRTEYLKDVVYNENLIGLVVCKIEIPAHYKSFKKPDLVESNFLVEKYQLVSPASITKWTTKKEPRKLKKNQYYYRQGNWSKMRELITSSSCPQVYIVKEVEERLVALGYHDLIVDNFFDEYDRKALEDFQKRNNLKVGFIDLKTLNALGLRN